MEDNKQIQETASSTELTIEQLEAVCGGVKLADDSSIEPDVTAGLWLVGSAIVTPVASAASTVVNSL